MGHLRGGEAMSRRPITAKEAREMALKMGEDAKKRLHEERIAEGAPEPEWTRQRVEEVLGPVPEGVGYHVWISSGERNFAGSVGFPAAKIPLDVEKLKALVWVLEHPEEFK